MKPYRKENIPRAKELRKNMTPWERKLWYEFLRNYPLRFQRQKAVGDYIADFYCAKAGLVVELDGGGHYAGREGQGTHRSIGANGAAGPALLQSGCGAIFFSGVRMDRPCRSDVSPSVGFADSSLIRGSRRRQELTLKNKPPSDEGGGTAPAVTEGENTATRPARRFGRKSESFPRSVQKNG